jgi:hypothetical protein
MKPIGTVVFSRLTTALPFYINAIERYHMGGRAPFSVNMNVTLLAIEPAYIFSRFEVQTNTVLRSDALAAAAVLAIPSRCAMERL